MKEKEGELVRLLVEHSDEKKALKGRIAILESKLNEVRDGNGKRERGDDFFFYISILLVNIALFCIILKFSYFTNFHRNVQLKAELVPLLFLSFLGLKAQNSCWLHLTTKIDKREFFFLEE